MDNGRPNNAALVIAVSIQRHVDAATGEKVRVYPRIPPFLPVSNRREIWLELSATPLFRLKKHAATKTHKKITTWKQFYRLTAQHGVAAASHIWIHTFFFFTSASIFAASASACRAVSASLHG